MRYRARMDWDAAIGGFLGAGSVAAGLLAFGKNMFLEALKHGAARELETLRRDHAKELQELKRDHDAQLEASRQNFIRELERDRERLQNQIEGARAVAAHQLETFKAELTLAAEVRRQVAARRVEALDRLARDAVEVGRLMWNIAANDREGLAKIKAHIDERIASSHLFSPKLVDALRRFADAAWDTKVDWSDPHRVHSPGASAYRVERERVEALQSALLAAIRHELGVVDAKREPTVDTEGPR